MIQTSTASFVAFFFLLKGADGIWHKGDKDKSLMHHRRFLIDQNSTNAWVSLEQFAACSLTCVQGYEKLAETCCNTGIDVVCLNLPWDMLKDSVGSCTGRTISNVQTHSSQTVLEQFAACSLTCIFGYEKLANVCCTSGIKEVCANLPWEMLKPSLGQCHAKTTSPTTTTPAKTLTTKQVAYWLPWNEWQCDSQRHSCFQRRFRNCSTFVDSDCKDQLGGVRYNIEVCTPAICPEFFTTTMSSMNSSSTPQGTCRDRPTATACKISEVLSVVCASKSTAWELCPKSCNLCNTCWDYLNCSSLEARQLFCSREDYAVQYCRQTCGRCSHNPVPIQLNSCGDPVANDQICQMLQSEMCICNDPTFRVLCQNYCDNKCRLYPFPGSSCIPSRKKREAAFRGILGK